MLRQVLVSISKILDLNFEPKEHVISELSRSNGFMLDHTKAPEFYLNFYKRILNTFDTNASINAP